MKNTLFAGLLVSLAVISLQACSSQKTETAPVPAADAPLAGSPSAEAPATNSPQDDFQVIDGYRFKLSPDVQSDGVAHLDFYVRDNADKHLKGVKGTFVITKPDGTKAELPIAEEAPNDHYHGMIKLDQAGDYLIVARVEIDGKQLNPRFSFTRKL